MSILSKVLDATHAFLAAMAETPGAASVAVLLVFIPVAVKLLVALKGITLSFRKLKLEEARALYEMLSKDTDGPPEFVKDMTFRSLTRSKIGILQLTTIYESHPHSFREITNFLHRHIDRLCWDDENKGVALRSKNKTSWSIVMNSVLYALLAFVGMQIAGLSTQPPSLRNATDPILWIGLVLIGTGALFLIDAIRAFECLRFAKKFGRQEESKHAE